MPNRLLFDRQSAQRARLRKGLTLQELAERCAKAGVPIPKCTLSRWENGIQGPTPKRLPILAKALDVAVDDLLTSAEESRAESAR